MGRLPPWRFELGGEFGEGRPRALPLTCGLPAHEQDRIDFVCAKESVALEPDAFQLLASISGGDLRKAVTTLQSAVRLSGGSVDRCGGED